MLGFVLSRAGRGGFGLLLATVLCAIYGCSSNSDGPCPCNQSPPGSTDQISAEVSGGQECKEFPTGLFPARTDPHLDCVEYEYDGADTLILRHINTAFNCCPDSTYALCSGSENVITIEEFEIVPEPCDCLCLYDQQVTIAGVGPGLYSIRYVALYVPEGQAQHDFEVDLDEAESGEQCIDRSDYPWDE